MSDIYRVVRHDGGVEYTDTPFGAGSVQGLRADGTAQPEKKRTDHELAKDLIKEAQKRIPKVVDYLDYVDYLRHNSPVRFDRVMDELRRQDPQTWIKLQKYPQFRPLRETAIGLKAGEKMLSSGLGMATGNFTGSAEKWMETTLKDLMKRDHFGPYADVLGAKATTLPTKTPTYSNSRLGQHLKVEDAKASAAANRAAKELELAERGLRASKGATVVRTVGPVVDLGIGMLDTGVWQGVLALRMQRVLRNLPVDHEDSVHAHDLFSSGRYKELTEFLDQLSGSKR